jgi:hypothetical protein
LLHLKTVTSFACIAAHATSLAGVRCNPSTLSFFADGSEMCIAFVSFKCLIDSCVQLLLELVHLVPISAVFLLLFGAAVRGAHAIMQLFELQPGFTYALLQVCCFKCDA